jgi:preprotein translocase subunit SecE
MEWITTVIPWQDIFALLVFFFYVESVVEVLKIIWPFNKLQTVKGTKVLVFVIAWVFAGAADYGVLGNLIQIGMHAKPFLRLLDYAATAAVIARFSGLTYDQIEAMLAKIDAKKKVANES